MNPDISADCRDQRGFSSIPDTDRLAKTPRALPKGAPDFDGSFPLPVALQEARRSRSLSVADDVALIHGSAGQEKRGVPNPWSVPIRGILWVPIRENLWGDRPHFESPTRNRPSGCYKRMVQMRETDYYQTFEIIYISEFGTESLPLRHLSENTQI